MSEWNPAYTLRDYQQDACRSTLAGWQGKGEAGERFEKQIGVCGTGGGKTIMAAGLIHEEVRRRGGPCLFLANTDNLVKQAIDKIRECTGIIAGREQGSSKASLKNKVIVASVPTLAQKSRLQRFPRDFFRRIIADEAHLSLAPTWKRVFDHFEENELLGITATPARGDRKDLMKFYQNKAFDIGLFLLINKGALVPIEVQTAPLEIDVSDVAISDGEDQTELAEALDQYHDKIIDAWLQYAGDRKTIFFHPSRESSRKFTARLIARGITAAHVEGGMSDIDAVLAKYKRGDYRVLNNSHLLATGFDEATIQCVVNLRALRSKTLYQQIVGRGTRLWCPNRCMLYCDCPDRKINLLLLDFLWQYSEMGVMQPADLAGENPDRRKYLQKRFEKGERLNLVAVEAEAVADQEHMMLKRLLEARGKAARTYDARELAALMHQPELLDYQPEARWEKREASEAQFAVLEKAGVSRESVLCRGQATTLISALTARWSANKATLKQIALLARLGIENAHTLSFEQASETISRHMIR